MLKLRSADRPAATSFVLQELVSDSVALLAYYIPASHLLLGTSVHPMDAFLEGSDVHFVCLIIRRSLSSETGSPRLAACSCREPEPHAQDHLTRDHPAAPLMQENPEPHAQDHGDGTAPDHRFGPTRSCSRFGRCVPTCSRFGLPGSASRSRWTVLLLLGHECTCKAELQNKRCLLVESHFFLEWVSTAGSSVFLLDPTRCRIRALLNFASCHPFSPPSFTNLNT